jgi:hypothetical protein
MATHEVDEVVGEEQLGNEAAGDKQLAETGEKKWGRPSIVEAAYLYTSSRGVQHYI